MAVSFNGWSVSEKEKKMFENTLAIFGKTKYDLECPENEILSIRK